MQKRLFYRQISALNSCCGPAGPSGSARPGGGRGTAGTADPGTAGPGTAAADPGHRQRRHWHPGTQTAAPGTETEPGAETEPGTAGHHRLLLVVVVVVGLLVVGCWCGCLVWQVVWQVVCVDGR
jgi:hypothetical protein